MKDDTKEKIAVVGLAAVGLYILTREKDEGYAGFGGGGGIPLLPGDTEDAAEGDTIIKYIFPDTEPFGGFGGGEEETYTKKATYAPSLIPTYPLEYYAEGGVSELSEAATPAQKLKSVMELQHYQDPFAYLFSGRKEPLPDMAGIVDVDEPITKKLETIEDDRTLSQKAGGVVRGGIIESGKLAVIGTGGGLDFIMSIFGVNWELEKGSREAVKDVFAPKEKTTFIDKITTTFSPKTAAAVSASPIAKSTVASRWIPTRSGYAKKDVSQYAGAKADSLEGRFYAATKDVEYRRIKSQVTLQRGQVKKGTVSGGTTKEQYEGSGTGVSWATYSSS